MYRVVDPLFTTGLANVVTTFFPSAMTISIGIPVVKPTTSSHFL